MFKRPAGTPECLSVCLFTLNLLKRLKVNVHTPPETQTETSGCWKQ